MQYIFPDYYKDFACIKEKCRHNCCIGWEIDIDDETKELYMGISGEFGKKLRKSISKDAPSHFILKKNDRCPFLNDNNLCEIIINLGEDHLCRICDCHPRFICELPERVETGLGLCCEAATALILSKKEPSKLVSEGTAYEKSDDEIIALRDEIITCLQNREKRISERTDEMLSLCDCSLPALPFSEWADFFLSLERLDEKWTEVLSEAKELYPTTDLEAFERHMKDRSSEFEQLLVYFIYRHFASSPNMAEAKIRAAFSAVSYTVIYTLGAVTYTKNKRFDFEEMCELARLYSSEVEYSEDNLYAVFDELESLLN